MKKIILALICLTAFSLQASAKEKNSKDSINFEFETTKDVTYSGKGGIVVTFTTTKKSTGEKCVTTCNYSQSSHQILYKLDTVKMEKSSKDDIDCMHQLGIFDIYLANINAAAPFHQYQILTLPSTRRSPANDILILPNSVDDTPDAAAPMPADKGDKKD